VDWVRRDGLLPLTQALIGRRAQALTKAGLMTSVVRDALSGQAAHAAVEARFREDQVSLILGSAVFRDEPESVAPLMRAWGGEAVYRNEDDADRDKVTAPGTPTIVVASADLSAETNRRYFPDPCKVFVRHVLHLGRAWADIFLSRPIPPADILDLWQPGSPEYHRFAGLPRA